MSARPHPDEVQALALVLSRAHRKLRLGSLHPKDPGGPNALARAIAETFLEQRIVAVEVEEVE